MADVGILTATSSGWLWTGDVVFEHSWDDIRCSGEQRHGSEFFIETSSGDTPTALQLSRRPPRHCL